MRRRSKARTRALQALYAWEAQGHPPDAERFIHDLAVDDPFVHQLVAAVATHRAEIDRRIADVMPNWRLDRLSAVDRNVLRLGTAELAYVGQAPGPVCIQEAIQLAERFGTSESPRFVNGVLDAVWRRLREEGAGIPE
ncbi:MAG: transcription antitermination factor NusB [Gemmatimonadota bacterium]